MKNAKEKTNFIFYDLKDTLFRCVKINREGTGEKERQNDNERRKKTDRNR